MWKLLLVAGLCALASSAEVHHRNHTHHTNVTEPAKVNVSHVIHQKLHHFRKMLIHFHHVRQLHHRPSGFHGFHMHVKLNLHALAKKLHSWLFGYKQPHHVDTTTTAKRVKTATTASTSTAQPRHTAKLIHPTQPHKTKKATTMTTDRMLVEPKPVHVLVVDPVPKPVPSGVVVDPTMLAHKNKTSQKPHVIKVITPRPARVHFKKHFHLYLRTFHFHLKKSLYRSHLSHHSPFSHYSLGHPMHSPMPTVKVEPMSKNSHSHRGYYYYYYSHDPRYAMLRRLMLLTALTCLVTCICLNCSRNRRRRALSASQRRALTQRLCEIEGSAATGEVSVPMYVHQKDVRFTSPNGESECVELGKDAKGAAIVVCS